MSKSYDSQIQQLEKQAAAARRNEEELLATLVKLKQEVQETLAEIGRLKKEKEELESHLSRQASNNPKGDQGLGGNESITPVAQGYAQPHIEKDVSARINQIEKQIQRLGERINQINTEISFINSQKLPQARQMLNDALSKLTQLKSQQMQLGRDYHGAYRGIREESSLVRLQQGKSYLDQGAGIAQDQYRAAMQRVSHIERVLQVYGSKTSPQNNSEMVYCGQYRIQTSPQNNFDALNGASIDSLVGGYNPQASYNIFDRIFESRNQVMYSRYYGLLQNPQMYKGGIMAKYSNPFSNLDY